MEESSLTPELDKKALKELKPETQPSKRRKVVQKTVVTVKIEANGGKHKNEGPPSDFWSWRKYGQKPIKGSPYPRGYYKCSTSKGCSAKKQVERCRTDASLLIITYTSSHNHPGPDLQLTQKEIQTKPIEEEIPTTPKQEQDQEEEEEEEEEPQPQQQQPPPPPPPASSVTSTTDEAEASGEDHFHYLQSPSRDILTINQEEENYPFRVDLGNTHDNSLGLLFDEEPLSYPHLMSYSTTPTKSEEIDHFFDELEELPNTSSSSFFTGFMRSSLFDERILVPPS